MILEIDEKDLSRVFRKEIVDCINWQGILRNTELCGNTMAISYHCSFWPGEHCHHESCARNYVADCDYPNCIHHRRRVRVLDFKSPSCYPKYDPGPGPCYRCHQWPCKRTYGCKDGPLMSKPKK